MSRDYYSPYFIKPNGNSAHLLELIDGEFTGKTLCGLNSDDMIEGRPAEMDPCRKCWEISRNLIDEGDDDE